MKNLIIKTIFSLVLSLTFVGCGLKDSGSSSSPDSGSSSASSYIQSTFFDAEVQGLTYVTQEGVTGVTGVNGAFFCIQGETVTFYLGTLELGTAVCGEVVTPVDLVENASGYTDATVVNIGQILTSLDTDGDLSNGIVIDPNVLNYDGNTVDVSNVSQVSSVIDQLLILDGGDAIKRTRDDVADHFSVSLGSDGHYLSTKGSFTTTKEVISGTCPSMVRISVNKSKLSFKITNSLDDLMDTTTPAGYALISMSRNMTTNNVSAVVATAIPTFENVCEGRDTTFKRFEIHLSGDINNTTSTIDGNYHYRVLCGDDTETIMCSGDYSLAL